MFKSLTGFEIQAISVGIKKKIIEKIWHNKKKKEQEISRPLCPKLPFSRISQAHKKS